MALLKDYLARKLIFEHHPALEEGRCLARTQTRHPCDRCREVCPLGVFDAAEPDWDRCDGCMACVSACPARCLLPPAMELGKILEVAGRIRGEVTVACTSYEGEADLRLPCLAALPWELIAFFALGGGVRLLSPDCARCDREGLMALWTDTLARVGAFLGEERYGALVGFATGGARDLSRRAALSLLFSKSRSTLGSLLPEEKDMSPDGRVFRRLLAHRAAEAEPCSWSFPTVGEGCDACGICTGVCPTGALRRMEEGGRWYLGVIPWRCSDCGLCPDVCPRGVLTAPTPRPDGEPARPRLRAITLPLCSRCGEPMASGETLCPKCQGEARRDQPPI